MKEGDYIVATKTIRAECTIGRRYKIQSIINKGTDISFIEDFPVIIDVDSYVIIHNGNLSISISDNFIYDYKYNRKKKLSKIDNNYNKL